VIRSIPKIIKTLKITAGRLSIVVFTYLLVLLCYSNGVFEYLELYAYDKLLQHYHAVPETSSVTVIAITENDINKLNRWPLSDRALADILTRLTDYNASVIGIDIYRDTPVPPGHKKLKRLLKQSRHIIAAMKYSDTQSSGVSPPPALQGTEQFGFIDVLPDKDRFVRRGLLFLDNGEALFYSFPLRIALMYLQTHGFVPDPYATYLQLGSTALVPFKANDGGYVNADANGYQFLLDFCESPSHIPQYSLTQLKQGDIRLENFRDKIILIGVVAESVKDFYSTSCSRGAKHNKQISGVMMHAAIVDQFFRIAANESTPLKSATDQQEMLWVLLWTLLGAFFSLRLNSFTQLIITWLAGLGLLSGITAILFTHGQWLIVVTPAVAWLISSILTTARKATLEKKMRSQLMSLFSKHVAPEIAENIWQHHALFFEEGRPRPQQTTTTVMFTDLQHFTTLAEELEPAVLFDWLNEYLEKMTPLVADHGGIVIRFFGDAIFAGFGIPVPRQSDNEIRQDAVNAVHCALAMNTQLINLNKQWKHHGLPVVGMRIGISTGLVATGSIGDKDRMEYTIHGDTVNTASRLEGLNKSRFYPDYLTQPCRILISETMLEYLGDQFKIKQIVNVELRGKKNIIAVYQVIGYNIKSQ
jgi:adenylate cyclase